VSLGNKPPQRDVQHAPAFGLEVEAVLGETAVQRATLDERGQQPRRGARVEVGAQLAGKLSPAGTAQRLSALGVGHCWATRPMSTADAGQIAENCSEDAISGDASERGTTT